MSAINLKQIESDIYMLLRTIQTEVSEDCEVEGFDCPAIQVTIACDDNLQNFAYQTGDNSYTGACYSRPHWAVTHVTQDDDAETLKASVMSILTDLMEALPEDNYQQLVSSGAQIVWA